MSLLIDDKGEVIGRQKMVHIAQCEHFYEQDYYTPAEEGFRVFDTELGRIGIVVCFDRHYPESIRTQALKGADLIIIPTANTKSEPSDMFIWEIKVQAYQNSVGGDDDIGRDWRTWGIIRESGIITRNGEDTAVLVCVNTSESNFYYDTDGQEVFGYVEYPTEIADKAALSGDVWSMFKGIDFADLNDDGNSDVTMKFDDSESELVTVWFWDTESQQFIYQPNESNLGDEGRGDIITENSGGGDVNPNDGKTFPV